MRAFQSGDDAAGERDVIVLDQHSIGEIEAMILAATAAHGVLVDRPEPWRGFSCVENTGVSARDRLHKFASQGCDAAHSLQEIQDDPLAGKNDAGIVTNYGDRLSFVKTHAVEDLGVGCHFVVGRYGSVKGGINVENAGHAADSRKYAFLLRDDRRGSPLVRIDTGIAGRIASGAVFHERVLEDCSEPS